MDLKRYLPGNDEDKKVEYFWALIIEPNFVQAGIWRIAGGSAQIVYTSNPTPWETDEDLVESADSALSAAIHDFPEELTEPSKTVFGVISSWVKDGEIEDEYLDKIKRLCKELSLKPAGFVVLSEAIAHYLKIEEGSPLNGILIGVYEDKLEVSLFNLGNLTGSTRVARSVSLAEDVVEGLARFNNNNAYPSRFILYNGKQQQLEDARQNLIKSNWDDYESIKFLHSPKIEIISAENKLDAVSLAGAAEMAEVDKVERVKLVAGPPKEMDEEKEKVETTTDNKSESVISTGSEFGSPEEIGFSVGEDAGVSDENTEKDTDDQMQYSQDMPKINDSSGLKEDEINNVKPIGDGQLSHDYAKSDDAGSQVSKNPISKLRSFMPSFSIPTISFGKLFSVDSQIKRVFSIGVIVLILLSLGGLALWWYLPKATVTIYLAPQQQNESVDIYVDPEAQEINVGTRILPGELVSATVGDERTISTTGTTLVGERATGEVTLFRVGVELSLDAGTTIRGPNNLRYSLDEDTTVASGSAGTPGTTTARVTAQDIGAEYNLASDNTFSVGNYSSSDIEAKNQSDFTGGTSREINAVSERDIVNLEDELTEELRQRALEQIRAELSENKIIIEDSIEETIEEQNFSADEGDEAETLQLEMSLAVEVYTVDESQLITMAKDVLRDKVPDGYVLRDENIEVDFRLDEESEGIFKFNSRVTANLLPQANIDTIKDNIVGKYPQLARDYLNQNIPGFVRAEISVNPSLPGRLNTLPRIRDNIEVEISAE